MRNIIKLILKYHFTIIFVLLELISFSLIIAHNNYQRSLFFKHTSSLFASASENITSLKEYFYLKELNGVLAEENLRLKNETERLRIEQEYFQCLDTTRSLRYDIDNEYIYRSAKVVNATFAKTKNYITINKGLADSIREEMAVCTGDNVVGIIQNVSNSHAIVLPLININLRISAMIKKNNYYGSLQWDGEDYRYSYLKDIPFHVNVEQGDTIVTSGFSSIFPEGKIIGFVETVDRATANFLLIKVTLATNFNKMFDVYVVEHKNKAERIELELNSYDVN